MWRQFAGWLRYFMAVFIYCMLFHKKKKQCCDEGKIHFIIEPKNFFVSVCLGPCLLVTDFCYLASCHSASAFQSGGFLWTAGDWMVDLAQICFGKEWISQADDASWCPAFLAVPTALHMWRGTIGFENRRPGRTNHSKPLGLLPPTTHTHTYTGVWTHTLCCLKGGRSQCE